MSLPCALLEVFHQFQSETDYRKMCGSCGCRCNSRVESYREHNRVVLLSQIIAHGELQDQLKSRTPTFEAYQTYLEPLKLDVIEMKVYGRLSKISF